jgi:hypothetical protein
LFACFVSFIRPWPITAYLIRKILKAESHLSFGVFLLTYCNVQLAWLRNERWNTHLYPILAVTHRLGNVLEISFVPQTVHNYTLYQLQTEGGFCLLQNVWIILRQ